MKTEEKIKLLYIIAYHSVWPYIEWVCRDLDRNKFSVSFIWLHADEPPMSNCLTNHKIPYLHIRYRNKSDLPQSIRKIYVYCRRHNIDIVHTHFMNACLAGLIGAFLAGVQIRIHTRHHAGPFPWYHRSPWGRVYDRFNNFFSSKIIAPCKETQRALICRDNVLSDKIVLIHHGFDMEAFKNISDRTIGFMHKKYDIPEDAFPKIGVVARYEKIKGIDYILPAFNRLLKLYPSAYLILANARGRHDSFIREQLRTLPDDRYVEIPFENDIFTLYKIFDLFIHVPISSPMEGFGQVYVEALAAGVPSIFTKAGVASEFIVHEKNAYLTDYRNSDQIFEGMKSIMKNQSLRAKLARNGEAIAGKLFGVNKMIGAMENLYLSAYNEIKNRSI